MKAKKAGKHKTKKETVTSALVEYIERREQKKIKELFGKIEYDEGSYKKTTILQMKVLVDTSVWSLALQKIS